MEELKMHASKSFAGARSPERRKRPNDLWGGRRKQDGIYIPLKEGEEQRVGPILGKAGNRNNPEHSMTTRRTVNRRKALR